MLVLGAALVAALVFQLWRTFELEAATRRLEFDKAEAVAERILRRAATSPEVFAAAAGTKFTMRGDEVEVDARIGWLDRVPAAADDDIVVRDRLDRAARAEFVDADSQAAQHAFDELLAAGLPNTPRMQVLAAGAWQARRQSDRERERVLADELSQKVGALRPDEFARDAVANVVASALRLCDASERPDWVERVVAFLPSELPLPGWVDRTELDRTAQRRSAIRAARKAFREAPVSSDVGMRAGRERHMLWWLPRDDGGRDVLWTAVDDWLAAVSEVGETTALPEWPWLVEPDVVVEDVAADVAANAAGDTGATVGASATATGLAGIPFLRGLRPSTASAVDQRRWLLPALTLALLLAFALAVGQQFRAQRREAAAVRAQAEFLTTVTHELKTPLASIRLLGEMLVEGRVRGREQEYYRMLASESGRLSMLIENVLDLGRVERGERAYDLRPCDVGEIARETVALVEPLANRDDATITVRQDDTGPFFANVDRAALVQALISVLDNARKYGVSPTEVTLSRDAKAITVAVRDHGPGVPPDERERIFARFTRGAAHTHGSTPGVGIGLYLARVIARRLGGDLVCSGAGDGTPGAVFTFRLPSTELEIES